MRDGPHRDVPGDVNITYEVHLRSTFVGFGFVVAEENHRRERSQERTAPGLVERPMHMYFDEEGALYVTDSSGDSRPAPLQLAEPSHRILRLVDKDGDGVFDGLRQRLEHLNVQQIPAPADPPGRGWTRSRK